MDLKLTLEMKRFVDANVQNGRFATPEEVLLAALTAFMMGDASFSGLSDEEFEALYPGVHEKIAEGLADLKAGRVVDGEAFFDELDRELDRPNESNRKTA